MQHRVRRTCTPDSTPRKAAHGAGIASVTEALARSPCLVPGLWFRLGDHLARAPSPLTLAPHLANVARTRPGPTVGASGRIRFARDPGRRHEMASDKIPMTREGADAIKRELKHLKSVERPKNVHDIGVARDHGDLRENAEYHAAKERQSHLEGRILMLEDR